MNKIIQIWYRRQKINKINNSKNSIHNFNLKDAELKTLKAKLEQIDLEKLQKEKQKKMEIEKIQLYQKEQIFSNTFKHQKCQVSEGGRLVAGADNNGWYFCCCEQAIPKTGKIQFAFQMISGSYFMVGIGFRDIMQKNNYQNCYSTGYGTYLIYDDGFTFSHHNKDVDNKQLSFKFTNNDIIVVEVCIEHKYINQSRYNNPQATVQLEIDTSQELYPYVGVLNNSKIKILQNVPP